MVGVVAVLAAARLLPLWRLQSIHYCCKCHIFIILNLGHDVDCRSSKGKRSMVSRSCKYARPGPLVAQIVITIAQNFLSPVVTSQQSASVLHARIRTHLHVPVRNKSFTMIVIIVSDRNGIANWIVTILSKRMWS